MIRELNKHLFENPASFDGKEITLGGWARNIRDSKAFGFIDLNDGSCFKCVQIVFEREKIANYDEIAKLNVGSAVVVRGVVVLTPEAKQPFEVKATEITVEGTSTPDYPLQKKRHTVEYLREQAYLRPRTNLFSAVFRVRSEAAYAIHSFFHDRGFVYVHTPLITGSDCEGAGEMFRVTTLDPDNLPKTPDGKVDWSQDFFGKSTNLTVSGQLEGETYAMAFGNIYTFGPTFRAENSNTARHAAEFWMIEPEIAFADLNDDMRLAWDMIQYIIRHVLKSCAQELVFFNNFVDKTLLERLNTLAQSDYQKVTYTEAVELLKKSGETFKY
ncbi:MAG: asparagine--tRNA ligase, partial [Clostridia bacterium]|nr:asparagine--tRNA ligase [Clostridia bacterium]